MTKYLLLLTLLLTSITSHGQEELDEACTEVSKKTAKILKSASEASSLQDKIGLFDKAIAKDPEKARPYFEYGLFVFNKGMEYYASEPNPKKGDRSMVTAKLNLEKSVELCEEYHAEALYCLGVINFYQGNKDKAMSWFERFLAFESDDNDRYPNNYTKMVSDVKLTMKDYLEEKEFYENVVPFAPYKIPNVSSPVDEYFPMISPDNELMFFTRRVDRKLLGDRVSDIREEFSFAQRPRVGVDFDKGTPFDPPFNDGSFTNYGAATMSVDNREIILCACKDVVYSGQEYLNCDLYEAAYTRSGAGGNDYQWSELKNLGPNINRGNRWEGQPSLSADGKTLYFAVQPWDTENVDIYYSERQSDGSWGPAQEFKVVNTPYKDKSPFIHQDGETFYFVSESTDERRGAGGLDIFYVRQNEDGSWTKPKNIGIPINTSADELGIFVSTEGSLAYYSSREGGEFNIYGFELYVEARPESVVIMKGTLEAEDGEEIKDASVDVTYGESGKKESFKVREDGHYAAVVKTSKKEDIMIATNKKGAAMDAKIITSEEIAEVKKSKEVSIKGKDLKVEQLEAGRVYEMEDILYASNSAEIDARSLLILNGFADFLKANPSITIKIIGHTDDVGDEQENLLLSKNRSEGVKNYLISCGVQANRLSFEGKGESQPKVENTSEANRSINRRTEFLIEKL